MGYTYFGDLLGISSCYKLNPERAYKRLDKFYNITFDCLGSYCKSHNEVKVQLFSDSLLIWGDNKGEILRKLQSLYLKLIYEGILLRGAIVEDKIEQDPRFELKNLTKMLSINDALARAVGLEKTQKGARLLIEHSFMEDLPNFPSDWVTHEGYLNNIEPNRPIDDLFRRISPTPDNKTYELLYFWLPRYDEDLDMNHSLNTIKDKLNELSSIYTDEIAAHHKETLRLFRLCERRKNYTERTIAI